MGEIRLMTIEVVKIQMHDLKSIESSPKKKVKRIDSNVITARNIPTIETQSLRGACRVQ